MVKITESHIRAIIKEELADVLNEMDPMKSDEQREKEMRRDGMALITSFLAGATSLEALKAFAATHPGFADMLNHKVAALSQALGFHE